MPFTSETSKIARAKANPSKRGKDKAWMQMGTRLTTTHARKIDKYLDQLWKTGEKELFFDNYLKLLQYFKPKLQATAIKQQTEIIIKFGTTEEDQQLFEDV